LRFAASIRPFVSRTSKRTLSDAIWDLLMERYSETPLSADSAVQVLSISDSYYPIIKTVLIETVIERLVWHDRLSTSDHTAVMAQVIAVPALAGDSKFHKSRRPARVLLEQ